LSFYILYRLLLPFSHTRGLSKTQIELAGRVNIEQNLTILPMYTNKADGVFASIIKYVLPFDNDLLNLNQSGVDCAKDQKLGFTVL